MKKYLWYQNGDFIWNNFYLKDKLWLQSFDKYINQSNDIQMWKNKINRVNRRNHKYRILIYQFASKLYLKVIY